MFTPDTKNWTWVVERECPECGFDASACAADSVAALVRANALDWKRFGASNWTPAREEVAIRLRAHPGG